MHRFMHRVVLICMLFIVAGAGPSVMAAQDRDFENQQGAYDLSAMMLTPWDLEDEGFEGFGLAYGGTDTLDEEYASFFATDDRPADEMYDMFEQAGFAESRWVYLDVPDEEAPDFAARRVAVTIDVFGDADGASEIMDFNRETGGEPLDDETVGDEALLATFTSTDPDTGDDASTLALAFSYENLIAQVSITDYATGSTDGEPTVDELVPLAERLLERIESVLDDGGSGIERQLLRFESDGEFVYYLADYFTRLDGDLLPRYGQNEDFLEEIEEAEQEFGVTDANRLVQNIGSNGETFIVWGVQIRQFEDDKGAEEWVNASGDWSEMGGGGDVNVVDADLSIGDATSVVTYASGSEDAPFYTIAIFVQVGDVGFIAGISYPGEPADIDIVAEIAEMQVECIEDGGCPVESPVPDSLIELAETLS